MLQRVLIIGHNDLDGIAGALAVKAAHREDHTIIKFCSYTNLDSTLLEALQNSRLPYDRIVLVDICFNPGVDEEKFTTVTDRWNVKFNLPEAIVKYTTAGGQLVVLDHHPRALQLAASSYRGLLHSDSILEMSDMDGNLEAGSDLAAKYYINKFPNNSRKTLLSENVFAKALLKLCAVCGAYDVWNRKSSNFVFGSKLAMAQSLMHDDPYGFLNELEQTLDRAVTEIIKDFSADQDSNFWRKCLSPVLLHYLEQAESWFEKEVARARSTAIQHHPHLHEIYAKFFESLVAEELYSGTRGIILVRYDDSREKASKISLRKHASMPVNLGTIAKQFGGGGHFAAAGMTLKNGHSIYDVVEYVLYAIEAESTRKRAV